MSANNVRRAAVLHRCDVRH